MKQADAKRRSRAKNVRAVSDCKILAESVDGNGIKAGSLIGAQISFINCVTDISTIKSDVSALEGSRILFSGTGKADIWNQSGGYAVSNNPKVAIDGRLSKIVFSGITYVDSFTYDEADYTQSGSTGGGYTFTHTPAIYIEKVKTGGAAVEKRKRRTIRPNARRGPTVPSKSSPTPT